MGTLDYNELAHAYSRGRHVSQLVIDELLDRTALSKASKVIEVGCGTASHVWTLYQSIGCTGYGLDPSHNMMRRRPDSDIHLVEARGEVIPFTSDVFDLVFSKDVIHHMEDTTTYFREAFRVLMPNGLICTATDSEEQIKSRRPLSKYWPGSAAVDLERYPVVFELEAQMARAGFSELVQTERQMSYEIMDITPYKESAFSCLHLISKKEYLDGLEALENDMKLGPVFGLVQYTFVWGRKIMY
jgi:SAM-dependent methyltransferase